MVGKARSFSDSARESVYQKEFDDEVYSAAAQQNSYNLGSVHFSDNSGIANITQAGTDQRKANLKGALFTGNIGFNLQTALLDVPSNTIDLLEDGASTALSISSTDRIVSLSAGTTADLVTILGSQRPGHRLTLYNILGNTITIKHTVAATENTILTPDTNDFEFTNNMAINLVYDITTTKWRIIGSSGGGGAITEPIELGFNEVTTETPPTKTIVAGDIFNPSHITLDKDIDLQLDISATTNKYKSIFIIFDTGGNNFTVTWPASVTNPPTIDDSVAQRISVILYTINNGTIWTHATSTGSSSSTFSGNLSDLTINVNKDWQALGISNIGALTGVTGITATGSSVSITGIDTYDFFQAGQSIQNKADPDGGLLYNVNNLQCHIFRAVTDEIARFEESAANVFRLDMLDHTIENAKDIRFDVNATFAGPGAVPTIGYDTSGADLFYNAPDNAKHVWTTNNNELMGLTESQLTFLDGLKIQANPNGTNPGLNVGQFTGDPASTTNADLWYNSTTNKLRTKENNVNVNVITSTADFATTKLDNLVSPVAINQDLLFSATGFDIGNSTNPVDNLFVGTLRLQTDLLIANAPSMTSLTGNTFDINFPTGSTFNIFQNGSATGHSFSGTTFNTTNIIVANTTTFNDNTAFPTAVGQISRNGNVLGMKFDEVTVRRDSSVATETATMSLVKIDTTPAINDLTGAINFQILDSGINTTYGAISATILEVTDAAAMTFSVRANNGLISALVIQGDDNNQRFQFLLSGTTQARIQPVFDRAGYFVTPQVTDFSLNLGTAGSIEIPQINNGSPSLTDLNQAFGAFDGAIGQDIADGTLYIRKSSTAWAFYSQSGQVT